MSASSRQTDPPAGRGEEGRRAGQARALVALALGVPVLIAFLLTAFAWPAANLAPRELPIGFVAPDAFEDALREGLSRVENDGENAFAVRQYASEDAARDAIRDREVYGAFVIGADGATVLTASAASPVVAQILAQSATGLAASTGTGQQPQVDDVVPADPEDPRGAVLGAAVFPLVIGGIVLGAVSARFSRPGWTQAASLVVASALVGPVVVAVAQGWLDALEGDWWANAAVVALAILATAAGVAGLGAVLGVVGVGLGAAIMMLLGNPLSGVTSAPEMLPTWAGVVGQLLPPGAGGTLLRNVAFFDGAAAARPLIVLALWAGLGLLLVLLGGLLRRRAAVRPAD